MRDTIEISAFRGENTIQVVDTMAMRHFRAREDAALQGRTAWSPSSSPSRGATHVALID